MKQIINYLLLSLLVSSVANADDPECKISLDTRPAFGSLVQAGLKFLNPGSFPLIDYSQNQNPKPTMTLSAEAATVTLQFQGASLKLLHCDSIWVTFRGEDLNPPEKYYPAQLPVIDSTLVNWINFDSNGLAPEDARKVFLLVASAFKFEQDRVNAWFDNRLWEVAYSGKESGGICLRQTFPDFSIAYFIIPERTENAKVTFKSSLIFNWIANPTSPEPAVSRVPRQPTYKPIPVDKSPVKDQP